MKFEIGDHEFTMVEVEGQRYLSLQSWASALSISPQELRMKMMALKAELICFMVPSQEFFISLYNFRKLCLYEETELSRKIDQLLSEHTIDKYSDFFRMLEDYR